MSWFCHKIGYYVITTNNKWQYILHPISESSPEAAPTNRKEVNRGCRKQERKYSHRPGIGPAAISLGGARRVHSMHRERHPIPIKPRTHGLLPESGMGWCMKCTLRRWIPAFARKVGWAKRSVPNETPGNVGHAPLCPTYGFCALAWFPLFDHARGCPCCLVLPCEPGIIWLDY